MRQFYTFKKNVGIFILVITFYGIAPKTITDNAKSTYTNKKPNLLPKHHGRIH